MTSTELRTRATAEVEQGLNRSGLMRRIGLCGREEG